MPLSTLAHIKRCLRRRRKQFQRVSPPGRQFALEGTRIITPEAARSRIWSPMGGQQYHLQGAARAVRVSSDRVPGSGRPSFSNYDRLPTADRTGELLSSHRSGYRARSGGPRGHFPAELYRNWSLRVSATCVVLVSPSPRNLKGKWCVYGRVGVIGKRRIGRRGGGGLSRRGVGDGVEER